MNEMRKLMEAVEQLGSDYQSSPPTAVDREYKAFAYGVEWGSEAQYGGGGYDHDELPAEFKEWVEGGRKGLYEDTTDIQYPDYEDNKDENKAVFLAGYQAGHIEGFNSYNRPKWEKDETPEEAYEYWYKYDKENK